MDLRRVYVLRGPPLAIKWQQISWFFRDCLQVVCGRLEVVGGGGERYSDMVWWRGSW